MATTEVPTVLPEHIVGHSRDDRESHRLEQAATLPDLYQNINGRAVRYRIRIDSSYLAQSTIAADVWIGAGGGWVELCRLHAAQEFYTLQGPPKKDQDPNSRELKKALVSTQADNIAKSWQKVVNRLAAEAEDVLARL